MKQSGCHQDGEKTFIVAFLYEKWHTISFLTFNLKKLDTVLLIIFLKIYKNFTPQFPNPNGQVNKGMLNENMLVSKRIWNMILLRTNWRVELSREEYSCSLSIRSRVSSTPLQSPDTCAVIRYRCRKPVSSLAQINFISLFSVVGKKYNKSLTWEKNHK